MHKRSLCRRGVRLSVRLSVTFVYSVETNKRIFKKFSRSGNHTKKTILVFFSHKAPWQYFDETPLTWASHAGGVGKNRDLSQDLAPSRAVNSWTAKCNILSCDGPWQVDDTGKRRSLLMAGYAYEVFMTKSLNQSINQKHLLCQCYTEDNITFNCTQW